jgi:hypothetical protein
MNTAQILSLIAAIALGYQYVKPYLVKATAAVKEKPPVTEEKFQPEVNMPTMSDIVDSWSKLKNDCNALGLTDACEALDSVFPLFVKKK